jgi:beta-1,4-mannosyltransferase
MARATGPRPSPAAEAAVSAADVAPGAAGVEVLTAPQDDGNPYQRLLAAALARQGATARGANRLSLRAALRGGRRERVVHLHWTEFLTRSTDSGPMAGPLAVVRAAHLLLALVVYRTRGVRIVWTVHNLEPHEPRRPRLDRLVNRLVARLADTVLVHSRHCAARAAELLGREAEVAYHGNYIDYYPPPGRDRRQTRLALGVPADARLLLAFGLVRPYKLIPAAIAEFRRIPDPRLRFLVAGRALDTQTRREVELAAHGDERVLLRLERIPDAEVAELHAAADLALLAYRDVFSSGALMLGLSQGLPVLAAADSTAAELGPPPALRTFAPGGLSAAIAASVPADDAARARALETAERYGWETMAAKVLGSGSPLSGGPR